MIHAHFAYSHFIYCGVWLILTGLLSSPAAQLRPTPMLSTVVYG